MYTTINRHGASLSVKGSSEANARQGENKARQRRGKVALVIDQPINATLEGSATIIDEEEVSVTFEGDVVIVIC